MCHPHVTENSQQQNLPVVKERTGCILGSATQRGVPSKSYEIHKESKTDLLHAETGVCWRIGSSEVVTEEVVAVHLGLEAGDVTVAEILTELIDFL